MEQGKELVKSSAFNFVEESMQTLDGALKYANTLLASKLCPRHFYDLKKDSGGRTVPDYTKGKPEAVLIVLQHGKEVGMSISQSLQQIIPVNGLISIKGDGAKSLIFSSGKLEKGSWKETTTGSIAEKNFRVSITATRSDNGETLARSFSVEDAMRAGLWVTDAKLKGNDAWKYLLSPWYKYPERMIKYRALGFISRDLFPDVLMGMITEEEAKDYPVDEGTTTITKPDGTKLKLDHPQHKQERSQGMTDQVNDKIDKGLPEKRTPAKKHHTEKQLLNMGTKIYDLSAAIVYKGAGISVYVEMAAGKKSNKKYRDAILAYQDGKFTAWLEKNNIEEIKDPAIRSTDQEQTEGAAPSEEIPHDAIDESDKTDEDIKKESEQKSFDKQFEGEDDGHGGEEKEKKSTTNKQGIEIPEPGEAGSRPFEDIKFVYDALNNFGVDNDRWDKITKGHKFGEQFTNKEDFCRRGTVNEINELLNSL